MSEEEKKGSFFERLLSQGGTLTQRTMRGAYWSFGAQAIEVVLNLARAVILARLLVPDDFGLMGLVYVVINAANVFTNTGFQQAIIQRRDHHDDLLNTAWTVSILRGLLLCAVVLCVSPLVSGFYGQSALKPLLWAMALSFIFAGFENIGLVLLVKNMDFQRRAYYQAARAVFVTTVAVGLALAWRSVWVLVAGELAGGAVALAASYILHPYRPRLKFDSKAFRELFGFGKYVMASLIVLFFINQGDDALVGKVLGITALGYYAMAYKIANFPTTGMTMVFNQVLFPALSRGYEEKDSMATGYTEALKYVAILSLPMAMGAMVIAPEFVKVVLGEKWLPMVRAFQALCFYGAVRSVTATTGSLFQSAGRPEILFRLVVVKFIVMALFIYPLTKKFGITGAAASLILASAASDTLAMIAAARVSGQTLLKLVSVLAPALVSTLAMALSVITLRHAISFSQGPAGLIAFVAVGAAVYFAVITATARKDLKEAWKILSMKR